MSLLLGIVVTACLLAAAVAAAAVFIIVSLSRSARLIASRTGRAPIEAFLVCPRPRRRRPLRIVQRRAVPLIAFSRDILRYVFRIA